MCRELGVQWKGTLTSYLYRVWRFFLKSNLYVALGAGCLSYVSSLLQGVWPDWAYFFVAFLYVYAMHILNSFTDVSSKLNDPVQTMFYGRHRLFLLVSGALSSLASLALGHRGCTVCVGRHCTRDAAARLPRTGW